MRTILLAGALTLGLLLAGCASDTVRDLPAPFDGGGSGTKAREPYQFPDGEEVFCESADGCMFYDDLYHEYVLYAVDTADIDVLVVPPTSPNVLRDTGTMAAAVRAWDTGIDELAPGWLAGNLTIDTYVLGTDVPPVDAIQDWEILVVGAEFNPVLLFGIGLEPEQFLCQGTQALWVSPVHEHDGIRVQAANCAGTGYRCVALNTNFLDGGANRMYDLVAHEVGHCLGPGHVGDALDFAAKRVPLQDIMSYQHDPEQVHCVSTMNIAVLEGVYGPVIQPDANFTALAPGSYIDFDPRDYAHVACQNP